MERADFKDWPKYNNKRKEVYSVCVVYKLNISTGQYDLYCIALNPAIAREIRIKYREEAEAYGFKPNEYVKYELRRLVDHIAVVRPKYRIVDLDKKKVVFGTKQTRQGGYYIYYTAALTKAISLQNKGLLPRFLIQKFNRGTRKWDIVVQTPKRFALSKDISKPLEIKV